MKKFLYALLVCTLILSSCTKFEETSKDSESSLTDNSQVSESVSEESSEEEESTMFDVSLLSEEELAEYITLGEYKGLESEKFVVEVTDKDIENAINDILDEYAEWKEVSDRTAKEGDNLTVDFKGYMNGELFEGGTANDQSITIGEGRYIDGFEEGLVGAKSGETVTLNLSFPEDYGKEELNGKPVVFEVTVKKISEWVRPELTEEMIQKYSDNKVSTEEDLKEFLKTELYEDFLFEKTNLSKATYWEKAVANATVIKFPEDAVEEYVDSYVDYYTQYASLYGVSFETFVGCTEEEFRAKYAKEAESMYKEQMVLYAAMYKENYDSSIDEEKYSEWLKDLAVRMDTTVEALSSQYSVETLQSTYIYETFIEYVYETRVEVEPKEESSVEAAE